MNKNTKIYLAGHRGLVGSAILRKLKEQSFNEVVLRRSSELDLRNQQAVADFFAAEKPQVVFLAAAKVGGILANNQYPADFIYDNIAIQNNIIHQSYLHGVEKLIFLGSSCIYPKFAAQPMKEEYLLTGELEPTNEPYAIAKIAGIKTCQAYYRQYGCNFISLMPTNLYGINDNFDLNTSHVLPALLRKFYEAKQQRLPEVSVWGSGTPRREFLYCDDLADACVFLAQQYHSDQIINVGVGEDISIKELALMIKEIVGYEGRLTFDTTKPDGTPRKLLDVSKINTLGWRASISLEAGIRRTLDWYRQQPGTEKLA